MTNKQHYNQTRHNFLLTLFPDQKQKYAVHHLNGFVLVRQWNGGTNRWEVAIYTEENYRHMEAWKSAQQPTLSG